MIQNFISSLLFLLLLLLLLLLSAVNVVNDSEFHFVLVVPIVVLLLLLLLLLFLLLLSAVNVVNDSEFHFVLVVPIVVVGCKKWAQKFFVFRLETCFDLVNLVKAESGDNSKDSFTSVAAYKFTSTYGEMNRLQVVLLLCVLQRKRCSF
jgi:hypothetical protein